LSRDNSRNRVFEIFGTKPGLLCSFGAPQKPGFWGFCGNSGLTPGKNPVSQRFSRPMNGRIFLVGLVKLQRFSNE